VVGIFFAVEVVPYDGSGRCDTIALQVIGISDEAYGSAEKKHPENADNAKGQVKWH
jgi:hypothetical protein